MIYWAVVHTQARAENRAMHHLILQGYDVYLPKYLKRRKHARRVEAGAAPFFPRYLFVAIDDEATAWRAIRSTVGVSGLVCFDDQPARVPPEIVDRLRARENERGFIVVGSQKTFACGDRVRVIDGPFMDLDGLFAGQADDQRVIILLNLLGRQVKVRLASDNVCAAA